MKAVRVHEFGGPEVLQYEDAPDPSPGPGQALVRLHAAGVNFADYLMRRGVYHGEQPPLTLGIEGAGTVEAVGQGVSWPNVGDRVFGWILQSYAELSAVDAARLMPLPESLTFEQAAAAPVVFSTAWLALAELARIQPGERALVHAVGSGVGMAALQIARTLGAWVAVTAGSDWKLERAVAMGADVGLNYSNDDFADALLSATEGKGVDVALEGVGRATFPSTIKCMAPMGRVVIYGSPSGARVELDTRHAIFKNLTLYGMAITTQPRTDQTIKLFKEHGCALLEDGRVKPIIHERFSLQEAGRAHQMLTDRSVFGKLVLVP